MTFRIRRAADTTVMMRMTPREMVFSMSCSTGETSPFCVRDAAEREREKEGEKRG